MATLDIGDWPNFSLRTPRKIPNAYGRNLFVWEHKLGLFSRLIFLTVLCWSIIGSPSAQAQSVYVRIYNWYSPSRGDNFATTNLGWRGAIGDARSPDYRLFRIEGQMFNPDRSQPAGTVPVYSWYSPSRGDNFMTSNPAWRGARGDTRSPDYRFVRLEGYVYDPYAPPPQGAVPLHSWYDPDRGDNFLTTNRGWAGVKGVSNRSPNYRYVRREGYVVPYDQNPGEVFVDIPVYFQFQYNHTDSRTGLPAYGSAADPETMRDVDEALARLNDMMEQARGLDSRRLVFARAGVRYLPTPAERTDAIPLFLWYSLSRKDNFLTTNPAWRIGPEEENRSPDYRPVRKVGLLFRPDRRQPSGTIPVYSWYSPGRGDNFLTSNPVWHGERGDTRSPDYRFVRLEGYIYSPDLPPPPNALPLYSWYDPDYGDNFATTSHGWEGSSGDMRLPNYRFVRLEGYALTPPGCDLLGTRLAAARLDGAINVLMTKDCGGVTTSAWTVRADVGSLAHELGHAQGQYHMFEGNKDLTTVERLYRDLDPNSGSSCYRLGDRICDTPPDYGFADADGSTMGVQCDGRHGVPISCEQLGPRCDPQEPMVDGQGSCRSSGGQGLRSYDPIKLGLQLGTPNNVMAYHNQDEFTYEQFLRIHDYTLWRLGRKEAVPDDEKFVFKDFIFGPSATDIWSMSPGPEYRLLEVRKATDRARLVDAGGSPQWHAVITSSVGRALLNFRIEISGTGRPSDGTQLGVTMPDGRRHSFSGSRLFKEDGRIIFDEIYGEDLSALRGQRAWGNWTIEIDGAGGFTPDQVSIYVSGY